MVEKKYHDKTLVVLVGLEEGGRRGGGYMGYTLPL